MEGNNYLSIKSDAEMLVSQNAIPSRCSLWGYSKWENSGEVVQKSKDACQNAGELVEYHFPDVRKMVGIGSNTERAIEDIALTRYACYMIAQNGDSRKERIYTRF